MPEGEEKREGCREFLKAVTPDHDLLIRIDAGMSTVNTQLLRHFSDNEDDFRRVDAKVDAHVKVDETTHLKVERHETLLVSLMWLFGIMTMGLVWMVFRN